MQCTSQCSQYRVSASEFSELSRTTSSGEARQIFLRIAHERNLVLHTRCPDGGARLTFPLLLLVPPAHYNQLHIKLQYSYLTCSLLSPPFLPVSSLVLRTFLESSRVESEYCVGPSGGRLSMAFIWRAGRQAAGDRTLSIGSVAVCTNCVSAVSHIASDQVIVRRVRCCVVLDIHCTVCNVVYSFVGYYASL